MKKICTLLLCIGLTFSLAACSSKNSEEKAYDALEKTLEATEKMKSGNYEATVDMTTDKDSETQTFSMEGGMISDKENTQFSGVLNVMLEKQNVTFGSLYLKDKTLYLSIPMIGMNQKMPMETMLDSATTSSSTKLTTDLLKPWIKKISLSGNDISISLDTEKLNKLMKSDNDTATSSLLERMSGSSLSKIDLVITTKDNMMQKIVADMKMTTTTSDGAKTSNMKMTFEYKNVNKVTSLDFPDNLDSYESSESAQK